MFTIEKPTILFYQNLGLLFYAIAAADKVIQKEEFDTLKETIKTQWNSFEQTKDNYNELVTYQMEIVFEWFDYEKRDAQECFNSFSEYVLKHPKTFTLKKRALIIKTATAIANSFSGKNKSELIMLGKLVLLFNKLKN